MLIIRRITLKIRKILEYPFTKLLIGSFLIIVSISILIFKSYNNIQLIILALIIFVVIAVIMDLIKSIKNKIDSYEMTKFAITVFTSILTILIISNQTIILNEQSNTLKIQTEILDRTSFSILPEIVISSFQGYRIFKLMILSNPKITLWK